MDCMKCTITKMGWGEKIKIFFFFGCFGVLFFFFCGRTFVNNVR